MFVENRDSVNSGKYDRFLGLASPRRYEALVKSHQGDARFFRLEYYLFEAYIRKSVCQSSETTMEEGIAETLFHSQGADNSVQL